LLALEIAVTLIGRAIAKTTFLTLIVESPLSLSLDMVRTSGFWTLQSW